MIQTDLYSLGCKLGTLVPWCKKCGAEKLYRSGKHNYGKQLYTLDIIIYTRKNHNLFKQNRFSSLRANKISHSDTARCERKIKFLHYK